MRRTLDWITLAALLLTSVPIAWAEVAPPEARVPSSPLEPKAHTRFDPLEAGALSSDRKFIQELELLLRSNATPEETVDGFTLMQEKAGLLFVGAVPIPQGSSHASVWIEQMERWIRYQEVLADRGDEQPSIVPLGNRHYPADPYWALGAKNCQRNPLRCSSALLLAILLDRDQVGFTLYSMTSFQPLGEGASAEIVLHGLIRAALLSGKVWYLDHLVFRRRALSEPAKEEIALSLSMNELDEATSLLRGLLEGWIREGETQVALQMGLALLKPRLAKLEFETWYRKQLALAPPSARAALAAAEASSFALPPDPASGGVKLWPGFAVDAYDDGLRVSAPGFAYFLPR